MVIVYLMMEVIIHLALLVIAYHYLLLAQLNQLKKQIK